MPAGPGRAGRGASPVWSGPVPAGSGPVPVPEFRFFPSGLVIEHPWHVHFELIRISKLLKNLSKPNLMKYSKLDNLDQFDRTVIIIVYTLIKLDNIL